MEIKLFNDLYDTLKKVVIDIKTITDIPAEERKHYRSIIGETFALLDTSLQMVIIRLNDILILNDKDKITDANNNEVDKATYVINEIEILTNYNEWLKIEREFRLCNKLRETASEMDKSRNKIVGKYSINNWDILIDNIKKILAKEYDLAEYISEKFNQLSKKAGEIKADAKNIDSPLYVSLINEVKMFKESLMEERKQMIKTETVLYDTVI